MTVLSRRRALQWAGSALALGCTGVEARVPSAPAGLESVALTPVLDLVTGAGGNVLIARTPAGLVLVDGGHEQHRKPLQRLLEQHYPRVRIDTLFNTHWHREQTGLNELVGSQGGTIRAHENTKLWLATEYYVDWQDRNYEPLPAKALPNRTFYTTEQATVGGLEMRFGRLPNAHTDGDIYVHFPSEDVIAVGGAAARDEWPLMDYATGGWLGGLVDASKAILQLMGADTRIVASTGAVMKREHVQAQLDMATEMRQRMTVKLKQGMGPDDMVTARIAQDFEASRGDPTFFITSGYRGLWAHTRETGIA